MVRMRGQEWVAHALYLRMLVQVLNYFLCVVAVTLDSQWQRFNTLQEDPCVEWRDGSTGVTQDDGTDTSDKCCCTSYVCKHSTVV